MRIISGTHKGRPIITPNNLPVRPTTDKAKESLFNILSNRIDFESIKVLDLFAGTGGISYEFASRGASAVLAVDLDVRCVKFIASTSQNLMLPIKVIKSNVFSFLEKSIGKYDIVFADPPYDLDRIAELPDLIFNRDLLTDDGLLIVEHSAATNFSKHPRFLESRNYSKVNFSFFSPPFA